jgi:uncharacterized protein (UPF0261 family)
MENSPAVLLVATMDTKGKEVLYVDACFKEWGIPVLTLDAGIMGESPFPVTVNREKVALAGGMALSEVRALGHEGKALSVMIAGAIRFAGDLYRSGTIQGILGLGGSMGTTLGTGVMRTLPIGFPKVMISTMASRNTRAFVGTKDILMLHSVCDLSGINRITGKVLRNGAAALAGMVRDSPPALQTAKPLVALSTLGTTETCAVNVRRGLESRGREVVVFHTVGSGGEAMEEMVREQEVEAVVDLSLHELVDHLFGGDYDAGPDRGSEGLKKGVPTLFVPGNIDFLVTGPLKTAEQRFPGRQFHAHNAAITVIRSERREVEAVGERLAQICNSAGGPLSILVPMRGFSVFSREGGPFYDPEVPSLFAETLEKNLQPEIPLHILPFHINDREFSDSVIEVLEKLLMEEDQRQP